MFDPNKSVAPLFSGRAMEVIKEAEAVLNKVPIEWPVEDGSPKVYKTSWIADKLKEVKDVGPITGSYSYDPDPCAALKGITISANGVVLGKVKKAEVVKVITNEDGSSSLELSFEMDTSACMTTRVSLKGISFGGTPAAHPVSHMIITETNDDPQPDVVITEPKK